MVTEEMKIAAWNAAQPIDNYDSNMFRKDACGAWIAWSKYDCQDSIYGWQVDHICPVSKLESMGWSKDAIDDTRNLRALQHQNNLSKSDDYPSYIAVVTSDGNRNIESRRSLDVNQAKQAELSQLYNL